MCNLGHTYKKEISTNNLKISHCIQNSLVNLQMSLSGQSPQYLQDLVIPYVPARSLRSASQNLLVVKRGKTKAYGDRAFSCIAPLLWNSLPYKILYGLTLILIHSKQNLKHISPKSHTKIIILPSPFHSFPFLLFVF